jgi:hypothetical protein
MPSLQTPAGLVENIAFADGCQYTKIYSKGVGAGYGFINLTKEKSHMLLFMFDLFWYIHNCYIDLF